MARSIADLHPDDHATRDRLRRQLRALREQAGVSQRELGERMGVDQANIRRLERKGVLQSHTGTVARWARGLRHRLVLEPAGFPHPLRAGWPGSRTPNDMVALVAQLVRAEADEWLAARTTSTLTGVRLACCVTQERLAARLDVSEQAVSVFEAGVSDSTLVLLQRYARGIARCTRTWRDGYLDVRLEPIDPGHAERSYSVVPGELVPSAG